jgi:hypothetical protein
VYAASYRLTGDTSPNGTVRIGMSFDYRFSDYAPINHDYETLCHFAAQSWDYNLSLYNIPGYCSIVSSSETVQVYIADDYQGDFPNGQLGKSGPTDEYCSYWQLWINADGLSVESDNVVQFTFAHEIGHMYGLDDLKYFDSHQSVMSEYTDEEIYYQPQYDDMMGVKAAYGL